MKLTTATILTSLVSAALAFESTVPCIMWSSKDSYLTSSSNDQLILKNVDASNAIMNSLSSDICKSQTIAIVNQLGLHRSDLASLADVKKHVQEASSYAHFDYVADGVDVDSLARSIAAQCDSDITRVNLDDVTKKIDTKIVAVTLPESALENGNQVEDLLAVIEEQSNDDYVVIYTSSTPKEVKRSTLSRRAPSDKPAVKLPIFAKYQLFSPAIFMGIAIVFLFVFIAGTGITWLVGIQTPLRFEGKQKKN
ncbi:hypothetical protein [Absidia glauca]|uniref:Protein BIG1 n=1 Tax=Absidia glauca TaxID=4829 RepID=A0A168NZU8_ABSGL|nr:hypothetical protein [Absidia glauca]